jgi:L-amino acid N-acyltransferase YncA
MAQIQPILEHYITETDLSYEVVVPQVSDLVARWEMIRAAQLVFLVTEDPEGAIVGWAYFRPFANTIDSAFKYTVVAESWVSPQHLDIGLGPL